ncbi:MAG: hypothetical protein ABI404_12340 [Bradyrhizobium sp.]
MLVEGFQLKLEENGRKMLFSGIRLTADPFPSGMFEGDEMKRGLQKTKSDTVCATTADRPRDGRTAD